MGDSTPAYNVDNSDALLAAGALKGRSLQATSADAVYSELLTSVYVLRTELRSLSADAEGEWFGGEEGKVACKVALNGQKPRDVVREVKVLSQLAHPNVIRLLNAFQLPDVVQGSFRYQLLFPFYQWTLNSLLSSTSFVPWDRPQSYQAIVLSLARQVCSAAAYLDLRGIGHRDLAPANILLGTSGRAVVSDFGHALHRDEIDELPNGAAGLSFELGTGEFRAPELLLGSRSYEPISLDRWSLGVVLASLFSPFRLKPPPVQEADWGAGGSPRYNESPQVNDDDQDEDEEDERIILNPAELSLSLREDLARLPVFENRYGDISLLGSIFRQLGKPDVTDWPEISPQASSLRMFQTSPGAGVAKLVPYLRELPNMEASRLMGKAIESLLRVPSSQRATAGAVLELLESCGMDEEEDIAEHLAEMMAY